MTDLTSVGYLIDNARTEGEMKTALQQLRDVVSELLGGGAGEELTISAGSVTPSVRNGGFATIDTESDAATDDLSTINTTNTPNGRHLLLRAVDAGRTVVVKHEAGGAGQISLADNADFSLTNTDMYLLLKLEGTTWREVMRNYGANKVALRTFIGTIMPKGYINGGIVSNATIDADHDVNISAVEARNDDDDLDLVLAADTDRATDALWTEGGPGLMAENGTTGSPVALPTSGTVHFFVISKDADSGLTQDYCCDTDPSGSNIGIAGSATAGWSVERRIGTMLTDATANLISVARMELSSGGVETLLTNPPLTFDSTIGTTASSITLTVPTGIRVKAIFNYNIVLASQRPNVYFSSMDVDDEAPSNSAAPLSTVVGSGTIGFQSQHSAISYPLRTNTSGQIRARSDNNSTGCRISTLGWIEERL